VRIDKDDNIWIWVIDKGSDMIVRFNPEDHVNMVFWPQKGSIRRGRALDTRHPAAPRD